jgi:hypothetical protein
MITVIRLLLVVNALSVLSCSATAPTEPNEPIKDKTHVSVDVRRDSSAVYGRSRFPTATKIDLGYQIDDPAAATEAFLRIVTEMEKTEIELLKIREIGDGWLIHACDRNADRKRPRFVYTGVVLRSGIVDLSK